MKEIEQIRELIDRIAPLLTVIEEQLLPPIESISGFSHICSSIPKEEVKQISDLLKKFSEQITNISVSVHNYYSEFSSAFIYLKYLESIGKEFSDKKEDNVEATDPDIEHIEKVYGIREQKVSQAFKNYVDEDIVYGMKDESKTDKTINKLNDKDTEYLIKELKKRFNI